MSGDARSGADGSVADPTAGVVVRELADPAELRRAIEVYRDVFDYAAMTPRLLVALRRNGGLVLGAFDGDRLVGFCYGFLGRDAGTPLYQYSQLAVVAPDYQGRGVGRALKLAQRDVSLRSGITLIRWTYDPMLSRNAHFNLDVLGASTRTLEPNMYGPETSGLEVGGHSDRLLVDWRLDAPPRRELPALPAAARDWPLAEPVAYDGRDDDVRAGDHEYLLPIPADWTAHLRHTDLAGAAKLRAAVRDRLTELFADGWYAASCRRVSPDAAVYRLLRETR